MGNQERFLLGVSLIWPFIASFVTFGLIRLLRKPKLKISIREESCDSERDTKYVHVTVENLDQPWVGRETALNCRSEIFFRECDTNRVRGPFQTKWATRPNPIIPALSTDKLIFLPDETMIDQARCEDIPPGIKKILDVAVKLRGDSECYVHTPENFFALNYRPSDKKLDKNKYEVMIKIRDDNCKSEEYKFGLVNEGNDPCGLKIIGTTL